MTISLPKIVAAIDKHNSVRIESEIIGIYKTVGVSSVFDSGFSGDLVIPTSMAVDIGLKTGGVAEVELADGSTMGVEVYVCKVKIGDITQEAATIIMGGEVLIGMGLMIPFDVCLRAGTSEAIIEPEPGYADFVGVLHRLIGA